MDYLFYFFNGFVLLICIAYVLFYTGLIVNDPMYINGIFKIIFSLYIIIKFNDFRTGKQTFTNVDRQIIVSISASILVFSFLDIIVKYLAMLKTFLLKYTIPFFIKYKIPYNIKI